PLVVRPEKGAIGHSRVADVGQGPRRDSRVLDLNRDPHSRAYCRQCLPQQRWGTRGRLRLCGLEAKSANTRERGTADDPQAPGGAPGETVVHEDALQITGSARIDLDDVGAKLVRPADARNAVLGLVLWAGAVRDQQWLHLTRLGELSPRPR